MAIVTVGDNVIPFSIALNGGAQLTNELVISLQPTAWKMVIETFQLLLNICETSVRPNGRRYLSVTEVTVICYWFSEFRNLDLYKLHSRRAGFEAESVASLVQYATYMLVHSNNVAESLYA